MLKIFTEPRSIGLFLVMLFFTGEGSCSMKSSSEEELHNSSQMQVEVSQIIIKADNSKIEIEKSKDDVTRIYATGPGAGNARITSNGGILNLVSKNCRRLGFLNWGTANLSTNFLIELGKKSVPQTTMSLGNGNVSIKAAVQNLKIDAGDVTLYAEDLTGKTSISTGKAILTLVHKIFKPVSYKIDAGNAKITAYLAQGYRSVSNTIDGASIQVKESSLPIQEENAHFALQGDVGSAEIRVKNLN